MSIIETSTFPFFFNRMISNGVISATATPATINEKYFPGITLSLLINNIKQIEAINETAQIIKLIILNFFMPVPTCLFPCFNSCLFSCISFVASNSFSFLLIVLLFFVFLSSFFIIILLLLSLLLISSSITKFLSLT